MNNHYILPSLNGIIGHEQLSFLKSIMIEQWDLVLCVLDYYAKGQDSMYEAYWKSYVSVVYADLEDAENYALAKRLCDNLATNRVMVDSIYQYVRNTFCALLSNQGIPSQQFNNITGVSPGYNYFRIEISNGAI